MTRISVLAGILVSTLALLRCDGGGKSDSLGPGDPAASATVGPDGCPRMSGAFSCGGGTPISLQWRSENDRNVYTWGANDFTADGVPRTHLVSTVTATCGDAAVDFRTDTGNSPAVLSGACGGLPYVGTYLWTRYKVVNGSLVSQGKTGLKCQDGTDFQSFESGDRSCRN